MRLADVTRQLQLLLPKYTDLFSDVLDISSIVATVTVATITTSTVHKLDNDNAVVMSDVGTNTTIAGVSQDGLIFTFTTGTDHDITLDSPDHENVTLDGFTDSAWNGSFELIDVPNRRSFEVKSVNAIPVLNGNEILQEVRSDGVNGRYKATVTSPTEFTIEGTFLASNYSGGKVSTKVRVAGAVSLDRAINQYTEQKLSELWAFVLMADVQVSKNRDTRDDSDASLPTGTEMRQRAMDGFEVLIFQNTTEDIAATDAIDIARHDLFLPLLKSVYGARFDSGLSGDTDFRTIFVSQGLVNYSKSVLIYSYKFQALYDLTDGDTVEPSDTRAYRDISSTQSVGGDDTLDMTVTVDLDKQPV